jgi:hypothetical protein
VRLRKLNRCLTNSPIFSCVHADALLADFDDRRLKRSVAGGAISFFGGYLFIRGSRFDDAQTTAVVAGLFGLASIFAYSRVRRVFYD